MAKVGMRHRESFNELVGNLSRDAVKITHPNRMALLAMNNKIFSAQSLYLLLLMLLCRHVFVVVTVDRASIFVGDGGISQADSSLQCRIIICARVVCLLLVGRTIRWICPVQFGGSCFPWR